MNRSRVAKQCICCGGSELKRTPAILMPFVAQRVFGYEPVSITPEWGLRDVQTGVAYVICHSVQCADCEVLFLDMRFDDEELASLYANYRDDEYTSLRIRYEPGYRDTRNSYIRRAQYIEEIESFLRPYAPVAPKVLDWGGDTGLNTPLLREASRVDVYDISNRPVIEGVHAVDLGTAKRTKYDLITCCQVLEHVAYPLEIITELASMMNAGTLLYLEVPYEAIMRSHRGSTNLHRQKRHWHEHINFFSETSIRSMLAQAGLELIELKSFEITLETREGCVLSALCRLQHSR
jgi:2-polyprenyl-3-methyl-5-hydroxy-6-metoxy-1,4-benzoquinol methylase